MQTSLRRVSTGLALYGASLVVAGLGSVLPMASAQAQVKKPVKAADAFVESIGVGSHLERGQYADRKTTVINLLKSMGIRYVRSDRDGNIADAKAIADGAGIKLLLLYGDDYNSGAGSGKNASGIAAQLDAAGGAKNVWGVEGANETDISDRRDLLLDHQKTLWDAANPKGIKVLSWSYFGTIKFGNDPNVEDRVDYGTLHPYHKFWGNDGDKGYPPLSSYFNTLRSDWNGGKGYIPSIRAQMTPNKPLVATEVGFSTGGLGSNDQTGMSEGASARYYMRALLGSFNVGFVKTFMYELLNGDDSGDGSTCTECRYGLAKQDGTLKPSGTAVKNLISILNDPGNAGFSPTALDYSLSGSGVSFKEFSASSANGYDGVENSVNHLVFQKANGSYYIVLWQEGKSWDWNDLKDASPARKSVTVNFGKTFSSVKTFEPLTGGYSSPTSTPSGSLSSLTVQVPDHPLIIELSSGSAPTPVTTTSRQINVGGDAVSPFAADAGVNGGSTFTSTNTITTSGVTNAAPAAVYQSGRWGTFTATVAGLTAGSSQKVRLHFAETSFTLAGQRKFNVGINGSTVLTDLDVAAEAGANKALVKEFTATANSSGQVVISFGPASVDNAFVNGIEVLANSTTTPPTSTGTTYYKLKNRWQGTYLFDNGDRASYAATASGDAYLWSVETKDGGYAQLRNKATGDYLHIQNSQDYVECTPITAGWWSAQWALEDYAGYKMIKNRWQSAQYVHIENLKGYAQHTSISKGTWSSQWSLEAVSAPTASPTAKTSSLATSGLTAAPAPDAGDATSLSVFPNPSLDGKASLQLQARQAQRATVYVRDGQGQLVSMLTVPVKEGQTEWKLPSTFPKGTYFLQATLDGQVQRFTLKVE